jgi:hypothetical protein
MEAALVIAAAVLNFILGGIWYGAFGKQWMLAWNLDEKTVNKKDPQPYLIAFIGSLWASYGLFLIIKHIQPKDFSELITIAVGTWLFILVGLGAKHYAFARVNLKAFCIDYLLDLIGITLMCFIIGEI